MRIMNFIPRLFVVLVLLMGVAEVGVFAQKKSKKKKKGKKEMVEEVVEEAPKVVIDTGPCSTTGPDLEKSKINTSLYREHYKQKNYSDALPNWRYVFNNAPGLRKKVFTDGEKMFLTMLKEATDENMKNAYYDTLMIIYDKRAECWGEAGYIEGKKALIEWVYRDDREKAYGLMQKSIDIADTDISYSIVEPYLGATKKKYDAKEISIDEFSDRFETIGSICEYNMENNDSEKAKGKFTKIWEKWSPVNDEILNVKVFQSMSNCDDAKAFYQKKIDENPNDATTYKRLRGAMKKFGCNSFSNQMYKSATQKLAELDPTAKVFKEIAREFYNNKDFANASVYFEKALAASTDNSAKAAIHMNLAGIHYRDKKFSDARKACLEAASLRPGWGKPYMLIGTLYASSGKLCGPGTGWDSQVVVWAAMDMWAKAKEVDPDLKNAANAEIGKYRQYIPSTADGHMKGVAQGSSYKIDCWINRSTTVRYQ